MTLTTALENYLGHKRSSVPWIDVHKLATALSEDLKTSLGARLHDQLTVEQSESLVVSAARVDQHDAQIEFSELFDDIEKEATECAQQIGQLALTEIEEIVNQMRAKELREASVSSAIAVYLELRAHLRDGLHVDIIEGQKGELVNLMRLFAPDVVDDILAAIFEHRAKRIR